jgi:hypothetical protein
MFKRRVPLRDEGRHVCRGAKAIIDSLNLSCDFGIRLGPRDVMPEKPYETSFSDNRNVNAKHRS